MIELVPRSVGAEFNLTGFSTIGTSCRLGLVDVAKIRIRVTEQSVSNVRIHCQARPWSRGWLELSRGTILKFSDKVLGPKLCPGSVELRINVNGEGLRNVNLVREPCWSVPPPKTVFCPKHFNSRYGRYVRFVYGTLPPDPVNPFFKLPALLYLIYYGSEVIKVGTTLIVKGLRRFLEQPTYLSSIIKLCKGIVEARDLEVRLSKHSRSLSQAPSMSLRVSEIINSIINNKVLKDIPKFACLSLRAVSEAKWRGGLKGHEGLINYLMRQFNVVKINYGVNVTELFSNSEIAVKTFDAERMLGGREFTFLGLIHGFMVFEDAVKGSRVLIPYSMVRDRLIRVEEIEVR